MNKLGVILMGFLLMFGAVAAHAANVDRISAATGVPVATLQAERGSTGLGWGSLEKAHLLANASGKSFDNVVALHQSGQGWGKIAHDNGLNLGTLVSDAHRSSHARMSAKNTRTMQSKSGTHVAKGHGAKSTTRGFSGSHGMRSTGHMSGSRSMSSMGHGGGRGH